MRTYCGSRPTMDIKHYFKYGLIVVASVTCCLELLLLPRHLLRKARHYVDDSSQNLFTFPLAHCPCSRTLPRPQNASTVPFNATTCSRDAFVRGDGQQVVSFSFYGDVHTKVAVQKGYFEGIRGNLDLMAQFYPNWIMRVYFDLATNDPVLSDLCDLACQYEVLDICHVAQLPGAPMVDARQVFAMNWRFFPTLDPQVDLYASRDLDSRFSLREQAAVQEWLDSDEPMHIMRDHPRHKIEILGAAWGTHLKRKNARGRWIKSWIKILNDTEAWASRQSKGPDQVILRRYVWPWARRSSIQHDSYFCRDYRGTIPFPTEREMSVNNFVAAAVKSNGTLVKKCPKKCRPEAHPDWEFC
ncbi:uncharacterized protein LOC131882310 [Tigriopus californicus]|uniref:uncharacterized protein LOC131882310 n=1 Tax=Tigriopus californicus TaxID=6832 RepID=UPI0027DA4FDA|nr:uncharacterized protein LOC131882310 [Tigriopus californicus]